MAKTKKKTNVLEYYYFTVDNWSREYGFEINRHPWEFNPDHHSERDKICVAGRLRTNTKRKFTTGEIRLLPPYVPRDKHSDEADRIGNAWIKDGRLYCSAFIPSDAYWSTPACLAAGIFLEMTMRVKNLRYNRGESDEVGLKSELSPIEDDEKMSLAEVPARIETAC